MHSFFDVFYSLGPWNWFILGVLLLVLETMIPGVQFLWFGIAAVIIGVLALITGVTWTWQVLAFGLLSVATVFWVRKYVRPDSVISDLPDLNVRGHQYVGQSLIVEQAIQNGRGKVRVGDSIWAAEGPDTPAGERVRVTGTRGTVLVVERATA